MSYTCQQEIQVLEDPDKCNQAFEEHILTPALQFIGLDCEWNTDRPVSLLQVATPTVVLLVRICKLNFTLPQNVKLVLEDPTICKVGVNIEHDSEKLGEDCFCTIKSWVDLRHVAIRSVSWGPCIVKQVEDHEYSLLLYDQTDPNSESAKVANGRRLSWCPKMGLESLIGDCLDKTLPKNTSARWSDDWECSKLQLNQRTYAANDATASLDIFVALVFASVTGHPLPFDMSFDVDYLLKKYASELEIAVNELLDKEFKQTKEDMTKIYKLVEKIDPDLDIKAYYTKPSSTKTQKKNAQKEFYKKQAREAAKQKSSEKFPKRPNSFVVPTETDPLPADDLPDPSQDLDSSRGSHTFKEITRALAHTKPNSKTITENFLTMQSSRDGTSTQDTLLNMPILFYFKHLSDKTMPLIPGYSYGRGSIPPQNYNRFRTISSETQTESEFNEADYKKVYPSYKLLIMSDVESNSHANTDLSFIFRKPPVNKTLLAVERTESPLPCSTTDDDQGSESSYTSSNYRSVGSKASKPNGRGRGRGKPASSIGSSRNVESDNDLSVKRGRGRGRGAMLETRAPKPRDDVEIDTEKVVFSSYDIRYQNADENETRPDTLNLEERSRNPTTSSQASTVTYRQRPNMSDITPQPEITTPTNSFTNAQHPPAFEDAFFETASTYSKYSIQDLLAGREPETSSRPTQAQSSYANRSNSADTRASYGEGIRSNHVPANRQRNPYSKKPSNRPTQSYEYKSDVFREAIERGSDNLHVGDSSGNRLPREAETPSFDWSKFREEAGIVPPDSSQNNTRVISIACSDSDSDFSD
ncbi:hypothetical protein ACHWQZ_G008550 [Mnemiopsis leidyi]